jgi:hypothetical protein
LPAWFLAVGSVEDVYKNQAAIFVPRGIEAAVDIAAR